MIDGYTFVMAAAVQRYSVDTTDIDIDSMAGVVSIADDAVAAADSVGMDGAVSLAVAHSVVFRASRAFHCSL